MDPGGVERPRGSVPRRRRDGSHVGGSNLVGRCRQASPKKSCLSLSPLFPRRSSPRPLYVHQRALQPPSLFCSPLSLTPSPTPNTMRASSLVAFSALSFALPYLALANDHSGHARRHHDIAARHPTDKRDPEVLSKRYDNMRFTFYDVGL